MQEIDVRSEPQDDGWLFQVAVSEGRGRTAHRVTMTDEVYRRLSGAACPPEKVVRRSFEFLLEREPKESILPEFDITAIARYFPEYEAEIARRTGR